jgi:hypothetical protein
MKNSCLIFLALIILTVLTSSKCSKDIYTYSDQLKLNAAISDTNEVLHLGDTLKIKLVVPYILNSIDFNGAPNNVAVNNLQEAWYAVRFNKLDTVTKTITTIWGNTASNFVTVGYTDGFGVYTTTDNKPYTSLLNIVPPSKGLYSLVVSLTPGHLKANNSYLANLIVNFAVADKHWNLYQPYISSGWLEQVRQDDLDGYGYYCFRVN